MDQDRQYKNRSKVILIGIDMSMDDVCDYGHEFDWRMMMNELLKPLCEHEMLLMVLYVHISNEIDVTNRDEFQMNRRNLDDDIDKNNVCSINDWKTMNMSQMNFPSPMMIMYLKMFGPYVKVKMLLIEYFDEALEYSLMNLDTYDDDFQNVQNFPNLCNDLMINVRDDRLSSKKICFSHYYNGMMNTMDVVVVDDVSLLFDYVLFDEISSVHHDESALRVD